MGQVFLSHVAEDFGVVKEIAAGLEHRGYTTWYYEEHSLPGMDHMTQTREAIERAEAVAVFISARSLADTRYVWPEIRRGVISRKRFVPLLLDVDWETVENDHPQWDDALGGAVAIHVPPDQPSEVVPRMVAGLERLGIHPAGGVGTPTPGDRGQERAVVPPGPPTAATDFVHRTRVEVWQADITRLELDAIASSADTGLGGDLADLVSRAAGDAAERERASKAPIQLGEAVEVTGGQLPARWVIYAATIPPSERTVRAAMRSTLGKADQLGARSIALPAFGTGGGGFSLTEAARIEAEEVSRHLVEGSRLERIVFAVLGKDASKAFERAVARAGLLG
jgi:O-acetyl-ADP-ribose deacetylase (regulator of RNase III)